MPLPQAASPTSRAERQARAPPHRHLSAGSTSTTQGTYSRGPQHLRHRVTSTGRQHLTTRGLTTNTFPVTSTWAATVSDTFVTNTIIAAASPTIATSLHHEHHGHRHLHHHHPSRVSITSAGVSAETRTSRPRLSPPAAPVTALATITASTPKASTLRDVEWIFFSLVRGAHGRGSSLEGWGPVALTPGHLGLSPRLLPTQGHARARSPAPALSGVRANPLLLGPLACNLK